MRRCAATGSSRKASSDSVDSMMIGTPNARAVGARVCSHLVRSALWISLVPNAGSITDSASACARPSASSGRSLSSP
ncbi:Uncharacterised protein [Mycobacteroides abscessus subsp. abscessus]|nr:Uncharacterised protein [Mycobacteroides abscessus subsp. abscessus]